MIPIFNSDSWIEITTINSPAWWFFFETLLTQISHLDKADVQIDWFSSVDQYLSQGSQDTS